MVNKNPFMLIILDGFGLSKDTNYNAVYHAKKPNIDKLLKIYPHTSLLASGEVVGLLPGYIGNSEVGHMTIGCGRVIKQSVAFIHEAIEDKTFFDNDVLLKSFEKIGLGTKRLHIMGMLSDAGVHSHIEHVYAFLLAAKRAGIKDVYIHGFLDGRDVAPKSAIGYIEQLINFTKKEGVGVIASLHGRFYAMDRDKNWDRTKKSYDVLVGKDKDFEEGKFWRDLIGHSYENDVTDEFIIPTLLLSQGAIRPGDGIVSFNFRPDRIRQLTASFREPQFDAFEIFNISPSCFVTPVKYSDHLKTDVMFEKKEVKNTLKDMLDKNGVSMFSIAETEKYAHVTYFFDGGSNKTFDHETRVLIKSIVTKNYVEFPEMSAEKITLRLLESFKKDPKDFYLVNYANCDMVGHSGNFEATVKAVECVDSQVGVLYNTFVLQMGGSMIITSDHGKAESMFDKKTGQFNTAHTTNPVPFIFVKKGLENSEKKVRLEQLSDIAPFILEQMNIKVPVQMI